MKIPIFIIFVFTCFICSAQDKTVQTIELFSFPDERLRSLDNYTEIKTVSLYGGGALLGLLTTDPETKENISPTGSIGLNFSSENASYNLFYSYSDKQTIEISSINALGPILMNPNTSGQSFSFSGIGAINRILGLTFSAIVVDNNWMIDSVTTVDASPILLKGGVAINPFNFGNLTQNKARFLVKLQYAHRSILGDFNNQDRMIFGVPYTARGYNGLDLSFNFYINSIELFTQMSINDKITPIVDGFSGTQVVLGLNLAADLIDLK